jgi:hypothetical protein
MSMGERHSAPPYNPPYNPPQPHLDTWLFNHRIVYFIRCKLRKKLCIRASLDTLYIAEMAVT